MKKKTAEEKTKAGRPKKDPQDKATNLKKQLPIWLPISFIETLKDEHFYFQKKQGRNISFSSWIFHLLSQAIRKDINFLVPLSSQERFKEEVKNCFAEGKEKKEMPEWFNFNDAEEEEYNFSSFEEKFHMMAIRYSSCRYIDNFFNKVREIIVLWSKHSLANKECAKEEYKNVVSSIEKHLSEVAYKTANGYYVYRNGKWELGYDGGIKKTIDFPTHFVFQEQQKEEQCIATWPMKEG